MLLPLPPLPAAPAVLEGCIWPAVLEGCIWPAVLEGCIWPASRASLCRSASTVRVFSAASSSCRLQRSINAAICGVAAWRGGLVSLW
jgi:hypothetical protein